MDILRKFRNAMIEHALEDDPDECCGLLAMKDGVVMEHYRMKNVERSPYRYSMDGKELMLRNNAIEDAGWQIGVIYHSHTHSPAYPSDTDVRLATWPDAYYLLVSLMNKEHPDVRVFSIVDGKVIEEPVVTPD